MLATKMTQAMTKDKMMALNSTVGLMSQIAVAYNAFVDNFAYKIALHIHQLEKENK